jgi:hypothetical protein
VKQRQSKVHVAIAGMALCAMLVLALLPSGQIPKIAGPCGRALCNCPIELSTHCSDCPHARHSNVLTFSSTTIRGADAPGMAFQLAIGAAVTPAKSQIIPIGCESEKPSFSYAVAVPSFSADIPTPPPRA